MTDKVVVTIKFTESEIRILSDSLQNSIDSESRFSVIPKDYHLLVRDLKVISKMMSDKKKEAKKEDTERITGEEEIRNGTKLCDNCET